MGTQAWGSSDLNIYVVKDKLTLSNFIVHEVSSLPSEIANVKPFCDLSDTYCHKN